ncbi:tripartite tricarboxylate transporter substrate binding protein [Rhodobacteraceae bacterium 2376]|uniref:Tripartite tricarboxylate transporter substrate binding protein n=1 Tax=Rhabdonatronobacter sediminivivens TaxID=2743469 RepID=A0A7Z0KZJ4_9RHOB|nr:tripartite tricarboxylate transporter substrate binding protein [Rhabdonatronobacter sediminivivens]NYS26479.1 tripartite tricarboxylate transporter substrate binding protein [Rhabdonatronobacter sediminivivens]
MTIRTLSGAALAATMLAAVPAAADFPDREITMVVPFGAGGSTDIVGRIAAQALSERLDVPVVVENRGGAGGTVGTQAAAGMDADGYAITVATTSTHVVGPLTNASVRYDPVEDFAHIGMIAETPYVLVVNPDLGVSDVSELIAMLEEAPGDLNFGSAGQGSTTHLAGLMFLAATGTEMEHIPYGSNAEATTALMGNEVQVLFGSMPAVLSQIQAESIDALAVGTVNRSPELPDVPTMQEAGVEGYRASLWLGLAAPAGTPDDVIATLSDALADSVGDADVAAQLASNGAEALAMTPEEFRTLISEELVTYGDIVAAMD